MNTSTIGWLAAVILLATMSRQVYASWRSGTASGVSHWLFVGQLLASTLYAIYSYLRHDPVFVATNIFMMINAILGMVIDQRNRKMAAARTAVHGD